MTALPDLPAGTIAQFSALCGSVVALHGAAPSLLDKDRCHRWTCTGCDAGTDVSLALHHAREGANQHASICRALPRT